MCPISLTGLASSNLKLTASKTTAMIMGTAKYINMLYLDALPRINSTDIFYMDSVNYLGLTISSTLS